MTPVGRQFHCRIRHVLAEMVHPHYKCFNSLVPLSSTDSPDTAGGDMEGRGSLSVLEEGCVCQFTWDRQVVTEMKKNLKKVGKHWVLLEIYSLREAVCFLMLTDKASKKQSRIFAQ